MTAPSDEQLAVLEGRLRQAVEAFVRELHSPSHVLTDVVVVAATADMADTSGATQYTVATPGTPYHGGHRPGVLCRRCSPGTAVRR